LSSQEEAGHSVANELKELLGNHLCKAENLRKPEGLATGFEPLDRFLFWGGLPKGALSLFQGALGSGATSLWLECAARAIASGRSVAWINRGGGDSSMDMAPLSPLALYHRGLDLERFVSFELDHASDKRLFWLLQELMSSSLFALIGCDLGGQHAKARRLKEHQIRKLTAQARQAQVALVFLSQERTGQKTAFASVFSLIMNFEKHRLLIERALHRPTPHSFSRSLHYARFTHHTRDRIGLGANSVDHAPHAHDRSEPHTLPEASRAVGYRL